MEPKADVAIMNWPDDEAERNRLRSEGRPLLLVVENGDLPPADLADHEDWIRLPAPDADVDARVNALRRRAAGRSNGPPTLDGDGVLRLGERWVSLPPVEARLTAALLARLGAVVSREALTRAGWPEGAPGRNALDVHVLRLRRRLAGVGLAIRTVRSRGYLLERSGSVQEGVREA
ncbi:hypothetical protein BH24ACT3_BH24ACT3_10070 [soil metagenome]